MRGTRSVGFTRIGNDAYETEIIDMILEVHNNGNTQLLAKKILDIYQFFFKEIILLDQCGKMAVKLMSIQLQASFELS